MPNINDILEKRKAKKFVKRDYRPWDADIERREEPAKSTTQESKPEKPTVKVEKKPEPVIEKKAPPPKPIKKVEPPKVVPKAPVSRAEPSPSQKIKIYPRGDINPSRMKLMRELKGQGMDVIEFFHDVCKARSSDETGPMETQLISQYLRVPYPSIKTTLHRLAKKGLVTRQQGKTSSRGFVNFILSKEVFEFFEKPEMTAAQSKEEFLKILRGE